MSHTVSLPEQNHQQWLDEARSGSTVALGRLFAAHQPDLLRIADADEESRLRTKADAEDLVQQVFLEASRDWSQFRGESPAELIAWLRQILRHRLSNLSRWYHNQKHDIRREIPFSEMSPQQVRTLPPPGVDGEESGPEQAAMIERILARLPEDYRRVIVFRIREGRSIAEIAGRMNRSPVAVRKLLSRAVAKARDDLERRSRGT